MTLFDWPGKSNAEGKRHPALCHMLDVAAAAKTILPSHTLARLDAPCRSALLFLIALHDCGKISAVFRAQIESNLSPSNDLRHWRLSYRLMVDHDEQIAKVIGGDFYARHILYAAIAGHHGQPPDPDPRNFRRERKAISEAGLAAMPELISALAVLFPEASLAHMDEAEAQRLSWLISGLTVTADWIGSNSDWFPFCEDPVSVADYWAHAVNRAESAVPSAGLGLALPRHAPPEDFTAGFPLRPMQRAVADATLPDGPVLALIEDSTGAGKTEAALILAGRMMAAGKADGIYFALPSMASSDAMFHRMAGQLHHLFDGRPSLSLAHGSRALNAEFQQVLGNWGNRPEDAGCAKWLADDRRLSLLAEIGVGTIDQALMAVLPTRFNTLRMSALSNHILIVDEAHDYDPYMETELRRVLQFHAMFGGSAIVMTATLPVPMRDGYARAYHAGLSQPAPLPELPFAYPALTLIGGKSLTEAVDPVPATCRSVQVERLQAVEAAVDLIARASRDGAACVWVRNSVDDAMAAVAALQSAGVEAELLHARFSMVDRKQIEARMMARFGRKGRDRAGRVLVATQIVQASLDLDFDLMVSDLAPIGDLIQRAGRLWRHMDLRPADGRPVSGPCLHVLSPDPDQVEDERWVFELQPNGGYVYPAEVLWRTARALFDAGEIRAPEGLRALIAAASADRPVPEVLDSSDQKTLGRAQAEAGQARLNTLEPWSDYGAEPQVFDDRRYPTRLGQAQVVLQLMRREAGGLVPWAEDPMPFRAAALSEVQISVARYAQTGLEAEQSRPEIVALRADWKDWECEVRKIAVVEADGTIAGGLRYDTKYGLMTESRDRE